MSELAVPYLMSTSARMRVNALAEEFTALHVLLWEEGGGCQRRANCAPPSCTAALPPSMVFAAAAATRIIGKEGTLLSEARDNIVIVDDVACPLLVASYVFFYMSTQQNVFYLLSSTPWASNYLHRSYTIG